MGSLVDGLFGGSSKKAAKQTVQATEKAQQQYRADVQQAKGEMGTHMDKATQDRLKRITQSQEVMQQLFAPMMQQYSQGNMNAQEMLSGVPQQQQNAILGNAPMDYSALQPRGMDLDIAGLLQGMDKFKAMTAPAPTPTPTSGPSQIPSYALDFGARYGAGAGDYGQQDIFSMLRGGSIRSIP